MCIFPNFPSKDFLEAEMLKTIYLGKLLLLYQVRYLFLYQLIPSNSTNKEVIIPQSQTVTAMTRIFLAINSHKSDKNNSVCRITCIKNTYMYREKGFFHSTVLKYMNRTPSSYESSPDRPYVEIHVSFAENEYIQNICYDCIENKQKCVK